MENEVKNEAKTKTFTKFSLACTVRSCSYTIPWSQYGNRGFVFVCVLLCMSVSVCDVLLAVTGYIAGVAERRGNLFVQVLVQK